MKYFKISILKLIALSIGACAWINPAYANFSGDVVIKSHGSNTLVAVWRRVVDVNPCAMIQAASGQPGSWTGGLANISIDPSDPLRYSALEHPELAVSQTGASTIAIAAWLAHDVNTRNTVVHGSILTGSGWSSAPLLFSANDGSQKPHPNSIKVDISEDGSVIGVIWSAIDVSTNHTKVYSAFSMNNGTTWAVDVLSSP